MYSKLPNLVIGLRTIAYKENGTITSVIVCGTR